MMCEINISAQIRTQVEVLVQPYFAFQIPPANLKPLICLQNCCSLNLQSIVLFSVTRCPSSDG